jgi:hypothetical protein
MQQHKYIIKFQLLLTALDICKIIYRKNNQILVIFFVFSNCVDYKFLKYNNKELM